MNWLWMNVSQRDGRGVPTQLKQPVPLLLGMPEVCVFGRRDVADRAVWPDELIVAIPVRQRVMGIIEREEDRLVQQLVSEFAVEAFDEGALRRFAWCDFKPINATVLRPRIAQLVSSVLLSETIVGDDTNWRTSGLLN